VRACSGGRTRLLLGVLIASLVAACASSAPAASPRPTSLITPSAATELPTAAPSGNASDLESCSDPSVPATHHDSPEVEAILPARVAGRDLDLWSVVGRCWLEMNAGNYPGGVDAILDDLQAAAAEAGDSTTIDLSHLVYGVAGRVNTKTDPPYFVWAAGRPYDQTEIQLAMLLLFGGAGYVDVAGAADLSKYTHQAIDGRDVFVGNASMVHQSVHQKGRPYLYQTDSWMFIVLTDDDAWAADAISQLP
jgi:hypothetical protein